MSINKRFGREAFLVKILYNHDIIFFIKISEIFFNVNFLLTIYQIVCDFI
ncbi:hypothetical protein AN2V17_15790 [Vallitalea sp. AN17-2]|uniref:Uncharacterized protein n=1 Tax=Vallitalea maricola TaxID=3074433 RepID=A0ACB5UI82_9FIRM|nr:hypothetical protein AN2V17_15790 [Vallitalea sp. AN17-2]